jgi:amino acid adenylation domain-containing protein
MENLSEAHRKGEIQSFFEQSKADFESSISARFERQVCRHADLAAVQIQNQRLTYDELNGSANRLAHAILARIGTANEPVALLFKQGASMITAILGGLKARKICAPVDYTLPPDKARQILRHIGASLLITDNEHCALAADWGCDPTKLLNIDRLERGFPDANPRVSISPADLAYINYTSGSTGEPKGVAWSHRNELYSTLMRIQALDISSNDRISLLRSNNVGATRDTFLALLSGATLLPLELKEAGLTHLASWLIEQRITVFSCVATVFRHTVKNLTRGKKFPDVRLVHIGGEPLNRSDIKLYKSKFHDGCRFASRFGMSETPTLSYYFIDKKSAMSEERVPVGYPLAGVEIRLVDDDGHEVGYDRVGQIIVKSNYLAQGYWRDPDLTREKFHADPNGSPARIYDTGDLGAMRRDGCLVHMGRKDFQTKIRGHRVELLEIELALLRTQGIAQAAVLARDDDGEERRLVAYVAPQRRQSLTVGDVRLSLQKQLAKYMQPSAIVMMSQLPLTASGKIDRRALPAPPRTRLQVDTNYRPANTTVEKYLANLWAEILGLSEVGILDDFTQIGGDSLMGARIASRVNDVFALKRPLKTLFDTPTIARLAAHLIEQETFAGQMKAIAARMLTPVSRDEIAKRPYSK